MTLGRYSVVVLVLTMFAACTHVKLIEPELPARHVILFIGDGMGAAQRQAARWSAGGQGHILAMDAMAFTGWSRTNTARNALTDSAAATTALATGVKTYNGMIAVDPEGNRLTTILEQAQSRGLAVGLITTTQLTHATPASFAAHVRDRNMMTEIARQMVVAGVDVLLGGGEDEFLPTTLNGCYPEAGKRRDGRNLIAEAMAAGSVYVCDTTAFKAIEPQSISRLLGLFGDAGMVRPHAPTLAQMTETAIAILAKNPAGFFLMVEGGQIDWACHENDAANAITDTIALDAAVEVAQRYASATPNTLVIVTADHETGGMSVNLVSSGAPDEDGPFSMPDGRPFYVNWTTTEHTASDVPTTAQGAAAALLSGTYDNTHIYHVMRLVVAPESPGTQHRRWSRRP